MPYRIHYYSLDNARNTAILRLLALESYWHNEANLLKRPGGRRSSPDILFGIAGKAKNICPNYTLVQVAPERANLERPPRWQVLEAIRGYVNDVWYISKKAKTAYK